MREFDDQVREALKQRVLDLETHFDGDVIFFYGPIFPSVQRRFRDFVEQLKADGQQRARLVIFLNTPGGSAETVEKLVEIVRFHYSEVYFVVPDEAMSAGTIFCMSGDKIYMDYTSSLGPIDPQIHNGKDWVPALGYLDQVERMIQKSAAGTLTDAELIIFQTQDLAMLSRFEQAKNLTITLLKKWLVEFKFKDWTVHGSTPGLLGRPVTDEEEVQRAADVATLLSDNKLWHSHGRMIGVATV
jgi:Serine dehydrogenase proteinase